jgi:lysophospholipase L1-like esterase
LVANVRERLPTAGIGFIAIKPSVARRHLLGQIQTANELVRERASRDSRLFYLDVFTPMLSASGEPRPELLVADGLHLNREGYRLWTHTITTALEGDPKLAEALRAVRREPAPGRIGGGFP